MGTKGSQRYSSRESIEVKRKNNVHPIWRGVGILMIFLIPALGYIGALLVIDSNKKEPWLTVPSQLIVGGSDPLILLKLILTLIIGALIYFLLMMIAFIIFGIFGSKEKGPYETPPIRWKSKDKE